ncbi:hypothetical protein [Dongia sp.]|uniref:hypothetical protein n=1 Tax=Dongia sp. TaxID=1977262 RepID=UPI00375033D1
MAVPPQDEEETRTGRRQDVTVLVKVLPKDPMVARREKLWPPERPEKVKCATIDDGPTSARISVVDYNADLDVRFAPARVLKDGSGFLGLAGKSPDKILESFTFHQINAWAIAEQTLERLESERALGRPIPWASGLGRLLILPHAGYEQNAFYDRATGALHFFYCEGKDGNRVFTCLSHDIVTHELGHAILDGLKPGYNEVASPETAGFHEYFGDAIAMMASLSNREIAKLVARGAPARLGARNVVSKIASEFGEALRGTDYLRGAWNNRKMRDLRGSYEEHDWSEILTGIYYNLLQFLYRRNLQNLRKEEPKQSRQYLAIKSLIRSATHTANIMLRAIDYCPPVDLRYDEYARAVLRADEVAYPIDAYGVRTELRRIFKQRGLGLKPEPPKQRQNIVSALRNAPSIDDVTATPVDAYRFLNRYRDVFGIPRDANLTVDTVYRTNKRASSGYWTPKERVIEFTWSEDVKLAGKSFGSLDGTYMPLLCGGTLVFDGSGNFLHQAMVLPSDDRREQLLKYLRYLVRNGEIGVTDNARGIGAPGRDAYRIRATIRGDHVQLQRNAAMRHDRPGRRAR